MMKGDTRTRSLASLYGSGLTRFLLCVSRHPSRLQSVCLLILRCSCDHVTWIDFSGKTYFVNEGLHSDPTMDKLFLYIFESLIA